MRAGSHRTATCWQMCWQRCARQVFQRVDRMDSAVMKVARIGCECGANVSTFSCFKLFGPEGVGAVVGDADVINRIRATLSPGGSRCQEHRRWKYYVVWCLRQ
ncbi:hypothetical protein ACLBR5_05310 [Escherichia coli]